MQSANRYLAIIDPALGESRGHHLAFFESLVKPDRVGWEVQFWCHKHAPSDLMARAETTGVKIYPQFQTLLYQYHSGLLKKNSLPEYIETLTDEFFKVLNSLTEFDRPWILLYHTLRWEHAQALAAAIRRIGQKGNFLQHLVFLMFPVEQAGEDVKRCRQAFIDLGDIPTVSYYASCLNYAEDYAALQGKEERLPIHPCFLADWSELLQQRVRSTLFKPEKQQKKILLYLGDPRIDKGFLALPELLSRCLKISGSRVQFIIQYARPQKIGPEIGAAIEQLERIADKDRRIQLVDYYWDAEQLHRNIEHADLIVLNYDYKCFKNRTSGLLWLACWWKTSVAVPYRSWLWYEARRLGTPAVTMETLLEHGLPTEPFLPNEADFDIQYRERLYQPLLPWLESIAPLNDNGSVV